MGWLQENANIISTWADIAQVVIAVANIVLAGYLFLYQKSKDTQADHDSAKLHEQNLKIQWFKELIVAPRIKHLESFFKNLEEDLKKRTVSDNLSDEQIIDINGRIKHHAARFRKDFYDVILDVDKPLYSQIKAKCEELVTILTRVYSDNEFKLTREGVFAKEVEAPIRTTHSSVVAMIYKYRGL